MGQQESTITFKCELHLMESDKVFTDTITISKPDSIGDFIVKIANHLEVVQFMTEFDYILDGGSVWDYTLTKQFEGLELTSNSILSVKPLKNALDNTDEERKRNIEKLLSFLEIHKTNPEYEIPTTVAKIAWIHCQ